MAIALSFMLFESTQFINIRFCNTPTTVLLSPIGKTKRNINSRHRKTPYLLSMLGPGGFNLALTPNLKVSIYLEKVDHRSAALISHMNEMMKL
jgi:hypothetical protein